MGWVADLFPLTPLGILVGAGGAVTWALMGVGRHDHVLSIAALVAMALVVVAVAVVGVGTVVLAVVVRRARTAEPVRTDAETPTMTSLSGLPIRLLPLLRSSWEWVSPPGVTVTPVPSGNRLLEQIVAEGRGTHEGVVRRFVLEDSLGLARIAFRGREAVSMRVLPALGELRRAVVVSTLAGGDELPHPWGTLEGDRLELRRHERRDPARLIVWKVFGRSRKLVVRQPERAVARARSLLAYLVVGPGDEPAAAAARLAVETGALGVSWVLGVDGGHRDAHHEEEALELIARSARAPAGLEQAIGLAPFLARNERAGAMRCLVFAPASPGPWVDRVVGVARRRRGMVDVVLAGDDIRPAAPRPLLRRLLLDEAAPRGPSREEVEALSALLARAGARVAVVDRRTGRVATPAHGFRGAMVA